MLESWCHYFSPDTFLEQTALTYAASLRGRDKARKLQAEQDISLAWHTAAFSGAAQSGKLKSLSQYLAPSHPQKEQSAEEMLDVLKSIKDGGASMDIRRVN